MSTETTNLLLADVNYKIVQTPRGTWQSYQYPSGATYHEFTSHANVAEIPLLHYTAGICPETGRRKVARGIFAVGRLAVGFVAIGQASLGMIGIGQATLGFGFALGQLAVGGLAVGQAALGCAFALGQFAVGYYAIGQLGVGWKVVAQIPLWAPGQ